MMTLRDASGQVVGIPGTWDAPLHPLEIAAIVERFDRSMLFGSEVWPRSAVREVSWSGPRAWAAAAKREHRAARRLREGR